MCFIRNEKHNSTKFTLYENVLATNYLTNLTGSNGCISSHLFCFFFLFAWCCGFMQWFGISFAARMDGRTNGRMGTDNAAENTLITICCVHHIISYRTTEFAYYIFGKTNPYSRGRVTLMLFLVFVVLIIYMII